MSVYENYNARFATIENGTSGCLERISSLEKQRPTFAKTADNARWRLRYLRLARRLRVPSESYGLRQPGLLMVSADAAGVFCFVILDLLSLSGMTSFYLSIVGAIAAACVVGVLFHYPSDSALPTVTGEAELIQHDFDGRLINLSHELVATRTRLESPSKERAEIIKSVEWRRAALLNREWRSLRDDAWEDYLVEVFSALGATPKRTGKVGD